jgi:hypothetical protein
MPDVYKILKDLEMKAVGVDPETQAMPEGYFASFRNVGLPIRTEDYENPFSPIGINLKKDRPETAPASPASAPKTASEEVDFEEPEDEDTAAVDEEIRSISRSQRSYLNTFLLTDRKLRMSNTYSVMPGTSHVSDTWWAIITGANGVPPKKNLSPEIQAAYNAAQAKLWDATNDEPTPKYLRYSEYKGRYHDKVNAYNRAYSNAITDPKKLARFPIDGKILQDDVDSAFDEWTSFGAKNEIEKALATLAAQGTDPAIAMISRAKKRFENSLVNFPKIGNIPYVVMSPESWYDADNDDGWYTYSSTDFHSETRYRASQTAYRGGGFSLGMWSVGGYFSHEKTQQSFSRQVQNLNVKFSYSVVDVNRIGMDMSLLNLKNWFLFGEDYAKGCISRGTMAQQKPAAGEEVFLPSVVTSLILIKDLSIKWDNWKRDWSEMQRATSGAAGFGFGCFAIAGSYSNRGQRRDVVADTKGEWLRSPGVQLIGYVSEILPQSPALNSSDHMK